jgi:flagellar motor switch protein FliN/FliY
VNGGLAPVHAIPGDELEAESLLDLQLRVWVEVGRARMPAASVVGMSEGAIIDLDREPEEPADLYVNGRHFGTGRLILVDGEWALRVETVDDEQELDAELDEAVEQTSTSAQGDAQASD